MKDDPTNRDLGKQGAADKLKGKANQAAGGVQKKAGQATGSKKTEVKGQARKAEGKAQEMGGKAEKKVDDTLA